MPPHRIKPQGVGRVVKIGSDVHQLQAGHSPPPSQTRRFLQTSSRAERRERRRRLRSLTRVAQVGDRVGVTWIRDSCNACQGRRRSPHPGTPIQAGRLRWSVSHPGQLQLSHARVSDACPTPTHYPRKTDPPPAVPSSSRAPSRPQARDTPAGARASAQTRLALERTRRRGALSLVLTGSY